MNSSESGSAGLEGRETVWRADGKTGMLRVILKRSEQPKPRKRK
jgi:hypothetical protein